MASNNNFGEKDDLSKMLLAGYQGTPELKKDEKRNYIGELKERILLALSKDKIRVKEYYSDIEKALKNERAKKLLMNGELVSHKNKHDYRKLADKYNMPYTTVCDRQLTGNITLVIACNNAVNS